MSIVSGRYPAYLVQKNNTGLYGIEEVIVIDTEEGPWTEPHGYIDTKDLFLARKDAEEEMMWRSFKEVVNEDLVG